VQTYVFTEQINDDDEMMKKAWHMLKKLVQINWYKYFYYLQKCSRKCTRNLYQL